ncbi:MAG: 2'-5' RNA ligase family protein [Pseudomonadota bacterium]|nr:2'-5' RNA ligase family protein [Pseudomonadota bacterium]
MAGALAGPLIVTAELRREDFAWLDALRRRHYPPERNQVPAHLTLFRSIAPSAERELRQILATEAQGRAPAAMIAGVMDMGTGVALRVSSDELDGVREEIAFRLHGLLSAQDAAGWSAHVTIQNKVDRHAARQLIGTLATIQRRPLKIAGLGLHRYLGGPWERLQLYPFRGP